jgi:tetratricopeptide (TPR) repeat protein
MKNMRKNNLVNIAIVLAMLLGSAAPVLFLGRTEEARAAHFWKAKDYQNAAWSYQRAAKLLPWRHDLWEQAGITAGMNGNFNQAVSNIEYGGAFSEEGWVVLAYSYFQNGDSAKALQAYQDGLKIFPSSAALYSGLAALYRSEQDWASERSALQNQIRFDEKNVYAHYRLGLLLSFLEPDRSLAELTIASSLDPQFDSAVQTIRTALNIASTQTDESQKLVTMGRSLGLVQEWPMALSAFQQAIQLDAGNAEAWAWLGEAEQQTGLDGGEALDQAISLDDESAVVRALRGLHWGRLGDYDRMLAEYSLAAQIEPENPAWQVAMGDANLKRGDLAAALGQYKRATELAPQEVTYWRLLAMVCAENGVAIEEVGLPAAQKAVELAPNDALALDALGFVYYSSGRYANAEDTLKSAIEIDPQLYIAHIHLAMNYLIQGNKAAAFDALTYVHDADPNGLQGNRAGQLLAQYFP